MQLSKHSPELKNGNVFQLQLLPTTDCEPATSFYLKIAKCRVRKYQPPFGTLHKKIENLIQTELDQGRLATASSNHYIYKTCLLIISEIKLKSKSTKRVVLKLSSL